MVARSVTEARKRAVLRALRRYPSISAAARIAGVAHSSVYAWCRNSPPYDKKVKAAIAYGVGRLEQACMDRAIDGVDSYVVSQGRLVMGPDGGPLVEKKFSDTIALRLLQAHGGEKYRDKSSVDLNVRADPNNLTDEQLADIAAGGGGGLTRQAKNTEEP